MHLVYSFLQRIPLPRTLKNLLLFPPGHFYSPIPSLKEVDRDAGRIFGAAPEALPGIDLNVNGQLELFDQLKQFYPSVPFKDERIDGMRYFYNNGTFSYADAIILFCMIRHFRPKRITEVGSGLSSCAILDTNEGFFNGAIECTFIDPYPAKFLSLINEGDKNLVQILEQRVQDTELARFELLEAGDILFVDSTHVAKAGSDVNHLLFKVLPLLRSGVIVHFHDIMYPFEYPHEWIREGKAWNESYLLRAFLQYNSAFRIIFFNTFLEHFHEERFRAEMPLCLKNRGGSIWLRKQ